MAMALKQAIHYGSRDQQEGQATVEYILLLAAVVGFYAIVAKGIRDFGLAQLLMKPITGEFAKVYRYGHSEAKGYDDGGPEKHALARDSGNFRIFMNSKRQ